MLRQCGPQVRMVVARAIHDYKEACEASAAQSGRAQLVPTANLDEFLHQIYLYMTAAGSGATSTAVLSSALAAHQQLQRLQKQQQQQQVSDRSIPTNGLRSQQNFSPPLSNQQLQQHKQITVETAATSAGTSVEPSPRPTSPDTEFFEVKLTKGSVGLGITVAGYVSEKGSDELSGIFVKSLAEGSAAAADGRILVNDRIIEVCRILYYPSYILRIVEGEITKQHIMFITY